MNWNLSRVGWLALVCGCGLDAHGADDYFELSIEELMQVEITGSTLTKENRFSVPAAASVFSHEQIQRLGVDSLEELMPFVPGFQAYRGDGNGNQMLFSVRGRRLNEVGGEVLVIIDGERAADPRTGGIAGLLSRIPAANIERVEFIRGPGSVIYGSNAMLGIINIVTVKDVREVGASISRQETKSGHWLGNLKSGDFSWDWFVNAVDDDGEDYQVPDSFTPTRLITSDPRRTLDVSMKMGWKGTQLQVAHMERKSSDFYNLELLSNGFNKTDTEYSNIAIVQAMNFGAVKSELRASYTSIDSDIDVQATGEGALAPLSIPSSTDPFFGITHLQSDEVRLFSSNDWAISQNSSLQFGAEFRTLQVTDASARTNYDLVGLVTQTFPITYYGDFSQSTPINILDKQEVAGLFLQYQREILTDTHMTLGLRYDTYSSIGANLSKRFGLVHDLNAENTLKLLYGEAFRAPGMSETGLINNPVAIGNPQLQPERVQTGDLIWMHHWEQHFFSLGYFEEHFTDAIVDDPYTSGARTLVNMQESPTKGAEFELQYQINPEWTANATLTHLMETPSSAFREAGNLASLRLNCQRSRWGFNAALYYQGEREMAVGSVKQSLGGYWLTNAQATFRFAEGWETYFKVNNLFDKTYQVPPIGVSVTEGIPNPGREGFLGVRWNY